MEEAMCLKDKALFVFASALLLNKTFAIEVTVTFFCRE
jgi:hypothetical protein